MSSATPLGVGQFVVACSNVAQNFDLAPKDDDRQDFWGANKTRYVTNLLTEPAGAMLFKLVVPDDTGLYPNLARHEIPYAGLVCYPTTADNPRSDYPINVAGTRSVPKMQRAGDAPIWSDAKVRYPVILYSHGLGGSPLSSGYLETIVMLASHGNVVIAPFHGDPRFADVKYDGLGDLVRLFLRGGMEELVEMQAVRPLSLRTGLDFVLTHPDYQGHLDPARIGGFGISLGGESLLLFSGAGLTTGIFPKPHYKQIMKDTRMIAAAGYVPYFGQSSVPAFGNDLEGLDGLSMPFLAIAGGDDQTAPIGVTQQGINRLSGSRYLVRLEGLTHQLRIQDLPDIFTWTLTFFDAYLNENLLARARIARMNEVSGGAADSLQVDYTAPGGRTSPAVTEYFNTGTGHYFITAGTGEMASIEAGSAGPGWQKTGYSFASSGLAGSPVCRFYGNPALNSRGLRIGPNSHFYTVSAGECEQVKKDNGWLYEGLAFNAFALDAQFCHESQVPVFRAYNNDFVHNNSNHRYTTSRQVYRDMQARGWLGEGVVFCANP